MSLPTPRRRRVQKMRGCDLAFYGNATTLLIGQLESGSHIGRLLSTKGVFREEGVAFTRSSPIKKAKQPHTSFPPAPSARSFVRALVPACSYIPAPVPHPCVFGLPSALAPSPCVLGSSRPRPTYDSFGSSQRSPFYHAPAPFRTLAISAPLSRLSFPLLRLPRARFSALPLHIP